MGDSAPVSVVIPTWNRASFLEEALASVVAQGALVREILVVDDGSEDATAALLARRTDTRIRVLRQTHSGVARARNAALAVARAPFLAFLDSDDAWLPGKLAAQLSVFEAGPAVGLSFTDYEVEEREGSGWRRVQVRSYREDPSHVALLGRNFIGTSTVMVRRACLAGLGGFDETLRRGSDYEMWLRLAGLCRMQGVPRTLARYRRHADSLTGLDPERDRRTRQEVLDRMPPGVAPPPVSDRPQP